MLLRVSSVAAACVAPTRVFAAAPAASDAEEDANRRFPPLAFDDWFTSHFLCCPGVKLTKDGDVLLLGEMHHISQTFIPLMCFMQTSSSPRMGMCCCVRCRSPTRQLS